MELARGLALPSLIKRFLNQWRRELRGKQTTQIKSTQHIHWRECWLIDLVCFPLSHFPSLPFAWFDWRVALITPFFERRQTQMEGKKIIQFLFYKSNFSKTNEISFHWVELRNNSFLSFIKDNFLSLRKREERELVAPPGRQRPIRSLIPLIGSIHSSFTN